MSRRNDWKLTITLSDGRTLPVVNYASRPTAIRGAINYARMHPTSTCDLTRFDYLAGSFVGYTRAQGRDTL